jgi:hypothetical protein
LSNDDYYDSGTNQIDSFGSEGIPFKMSFLNTGYMYIKNEAFEKEYK